MLKSSFHMLCTYPDERNCFEVTQGEAFPAALWDVHTPFRCCTHASNATCCCPE